MKPQRKPSQCLIPGVLTEADIIREHYRRMAKRGGETITPKKSAASRRNVLLAIAARKARYQARIALEEQGNA